VIGSEPGVADLIAGTASAEVGADRSFPVIGARPYPREATRVTNIAGPRRRSVSEPQS
jgi:hypothetical protein